MSNALLTKNACIYASRRVRWWLTARVLRKIKSIEKPRDYSIIPILPEKLTFQVAGIGVTLNAQYDVIDEKKFAEHIRGFKDWCSVIHEKKPDFDIEFFQSYLDTVGQSYGVVTDKEFALDSPVMSAIVQIADALDGFVFIHSSVIHSSGRVMFGLLHEINHESETA